MNKAPPDATAADQDLSATAVHADRVMSNDAASISDVKKSNYLSNEEAENAFNAERSAKLWPTVKANKRAILWSVLISTSIIMEGYDTSLLPSFYGYPSFQRDYGRYYPSIEKYQVPGPWMAGLSNGANCGVIIGGFLNGWASARFGYKKTMIASMAMMAAVLFVVFFSPNVEVLLVGQILCGIPWGVFATTGPAYASEVCPTNLRGYLTVYVNMCWATGQLLANGILEGLVRNPTQWAYRIPWALQWIWPPFLIVGCIFAPESPWWLVKQDRIAEAEKSLRRLVDRSDEEHRATISQMVHTIQIEDQIESGTSYWDCFKGVDLRRTEVCCLTFATQMLSGAQFAYGPAYFFVSAGMDTHRAYQLGVGSTALGFFGTAVSWILISYFGRRTIYLTGISTLTGILLIIGIIASTTDNTPGLNAQASLCMIWQLVYSLSIGPVCYAIISETSAIRLRAKTVVLARNTYNLVTIVCAVLQPYMMNPTEWNWKGKTAFFWAGTAAVMTTWVFFRLPETRGRTYEELDLLFAKKTPARKFKSTVVNPYAEGAEAIDSKE